MPQDGFVHCSPDEEATLAVARSYFSKATDRVVVLSIETDRLSSECRFEAPAPISGGGGGEHRTPGKLFPHIYGPIDLAAVTGVGLLGRDADGGFSWPERFDALERFLPSR